MAYGIPHLIFALNYSYGNMMKHINGCSDEQWNWKPYPECKSIKETVEHMIVDCRACVYCLRTAAMPDFEKMAVTETDRTKLFELLDQAHQQMIQYIEASYADTPLDTMVTMWGMQMPLAAAIGSMSTEYHYHAGQIAFIRMATDPQWDYYAAVFGA
ncbi:MAG: DinB family protein [Armatimonadota bacterium]